MGKPATKQPFAALGCRLMWIGLLYFK